GNGTATIFKNEPRVFTFSMHCHNNFPLRKAKSDLDIPLEHYTKEDEYLKILKDNLPPLIEKVKPDFIFFQSGVDILENDKIGKLSVSIKGCAERGRLVFKMAHRYKIAVTASMGGGYADNLDDIVEAHCNTYRIAKEIFI
ncbi:MAG: histone deacetylase, partial [Bacteroidota bacterium]|nr:histone deacetylase [Bacteroidota bacterium]